MVFKKPVLRRAAAPWVQRNPKMSGSFKFQVKWNILDPMHTPLVGGFGYIMQSTNYATVQEVRERDGGRKLLQLQQLTFNVRIQIFHKFVSLWILCHCGFIVVAPEGFPWALEGSPERQRGPMHKISLALKDIPRASWGSHLTPKCVIHMFMYTYIHIFTYSKVLNFVDGFMEAKLMLMLTTHRV